MRRWQRRHAWSPACTRQKAATRQTAWPGSVAGLQERGGIDTVGRDAPRPRSGRTRGTNPRHDPMHMYRHQPLQAPPSSRRIFTRRIHATCRNASAAGGKAREWNHRCTPMHTDGPSPAWPFTVNIERPTLASGAGAVAPVPSVCIGVHRWLQILAWSRAAPGSRRGWSSPRAEPHAPIRAAPRTRRPNAEFHAPEAVARLAPRTVSPGAHMRRWQDSPGIGRFVIPFDKHP